MMAVEKTQQDGQCIETPTHHLADELLLDYAAGTLPEAVALFVTAHLTLCPECRARVKRLEALGGGLLETMEPTAAESGSFDALMARIEAGEPDICANDTRSASEETSETSETSEKTPPSLPRALQHYVGGDVEAINWQPIGLGVAIADLVIDRSGLRAFMLKVPGGRKVPKHTHCGNEYVMVLEGAFNDEFGHFGRGDIEIADGEVEHQPIAEPGTDCICLAVTDAPLRITGPFGWLFNRMSKL